MTRCIQGNPQISKSLLYDIMYNTYIAYVNKTCFWIGVRKGGWVEKLREGIKGVETLLLFNMGTNLEGLNPSLFRMEDGVKRYQKKIES